MYGAHDAVPTSGCEAGRPRDTKPWNGTTSHSSAAATARNSINQYVTDLTYTLKCRAKVRVLLPSSGSR